MKITPRDLLFVFIAILIGVFGTELSIILTGEVHNTRIIMILLLVVNIVFIYILIPFIELAIYFGVVIDLLEECNVSIVMKTQEEEDEINDMVSKGYINHKPHEEIVTTIAEYVRSKYGR